MCHSFCVPHSVTHTLAKYVSFFLCATTFCDTYFGKVCVILSVSHVCHLFVLLISCANQAGSCPVPFVDFTSKIKWAPVPLLSTLLELQPSSISIMLLSPLNVLLCVHCCDYGHLSEGLTLVFSSFDVLQGVLHRRYGFSGCLVFGFSEVSLLYTYSCIYTHLYTYRWRLYHKFLMFSDLSEVSLLYTQYIFSM